MTARTWPDARLVIIDALNDAGFDAYPAEPNPRPAEFVTVRRFGGATDQDGIFDAAEVEVGCWSGIPQGSEVDAETLAGLVRTELADLPGAVPGVARWEENTYAALPDEISLVPRVLITGTLWLRPVSGS